MEWTVLRLGLDTSIPFASSLARTTSSTALLSSRLENFPRLGGYLTILSLGTLITPFSTSSRKVFCPIQPFCKDESIITKNQVVNL